MRVDFSIVGTVTYKAYDGDKLVISIAENGRVHECVAYGDMAHRVNAFVYVGNEYRINICTHWVHGKVICGVS